VLCVIVVLIMCLMSVLYVITGVCVLSPFTICAAA